MQTLAFRFSYNSTADPNFSESSQCLLRQSCTCARSYLLILVHVPKGVSTLLGERVRHIELLLVKHDNVFGLLESIACLA